jgi:hypothetical protein
MIFIKQIQSFFFFEKSKDQVLSKQIKSYRSESKIRGINDERVMSFGKSKCLPYKREKSRVHLNS